MNNSREQSHLSIDRPSSRAHFALTLFVFPLLPEVKSRHELDAVEVTLSISVAEGQLDGGAGSFESRYHDTLPGRVGEGRLGAWA